MSDEHRWTFPVGEVPWKREKTRKLVAVDIDDTLADYVGQMTKYFGPPEGGLNSGSLESMWPKADWEEAFEGGRFHETMQVIQGSLEGVREIQKRADIVYFSARRPEMSFVTANWLRENGFPPAPIVCIGRERKKALLRNGWFDVVIDDLPRYLDSFKGKKYIHRRPWNINNGITYDWKELKRAILSTL